MDLHQMAKICAEVVNDRILPYEQALTKLSTAGIVGAVPNGSLEDREALKALKAYFRSGDVQAALSTGSDPDGGYAVPSKIDSEIEKLLLNDVPMRRVCNVIKTDTPNYQKLVNKGGTASGWVDETEARPETGTPQLAAITPFWGELYTNPAATQRMLDDAMFDVASFLAEGVNDEFALQENAAFLTGNGVKKPKGLLSYSTSTDADATRAFGTLQHVVSGDAAGFKTATATVSPADCLIDLMHAVRAVYRNNATWMMNSATAAIVRKFKDLDGNYIWNRNLIIGQPPTLLGYPVVENETMPDVGAGALAIAFGDFRRAYTIVDRIGTTVLRDPYSNKPYVHFYTTKRVGGFLCNSQAVKLLKISA